MMHRPVLILLTLLVAPALAVPRDRDEVLAAMQPYSGEAVPGVDTSTLIGKVMCGYQGWFTTPGDGSERGWSHYERRGGFEPGRCNIDLWPDVSELADEEKFATPFRHADGTVASVFSSHNRQTVLRHFRWMREYDIDGVFVQRFAVETFAPQNLYHFNTVLSHCREGANAEGRAYAVMYDLTGLGGGQIDRVIDDWKLLVDRMQIARGGKDRAYLHHGGKPVVAVWGVGFNDNRRYTLADCERVIRFLKDDEKYGGCTVMIGVPTYWRTLGKDSLADKKLHDVIQLADIVSPWTVGRFKNLQDVEQHAKETLRPDLQWCREHDKDYLPVAFPGFSWHNMKPKSPSNEIPRLKGKFLWSQYAAIKQAGATMIYQAMFDELDEGTAIFKCTDKPPVGESKFVDMEGLPSDHYLWLTGQGGRLIRGEIEPNANPPQR